MTADEYLKQIRKIDAMIINKQKDYQRWMEIATGFGAFNVGDKVQSTKNPHQIPDAIGNYIDIEREVCTLKEKRLEIIETLERLPSVAYDVLFKRYVLDYSMKEIAYHFGKSIEWAKREKRESLQKLQRILDEGSPRREIPSRERV